MDDTDSLCTAFTQPTLHDSAPGCEDDRLSIASSTTVVCNDQQKKPRIREKESLRGSFPNSSSLAVHHHANATSSELAAQGALGRLRVRCRLWRIATHVHNGCSKLTNDHIQELLELRLTRTQSIREKSWALLVDLLQAGRSSQLAHVLLMQPAPLLHEFLTFLMNHNMNGPPVLPQICDLVLIVLESYPGGLQDLYPLDRFCVMTSPGLQFFPSLPLNEWFIRFAEAEAVEADRYLPQTWDLSTRGRCLLNFVLEGSQSKENIQTVVNQLCSYIPKFSQDYCTLPSVSQLLINTPSLRSTHAMHPALPFILFASHLSYLSPLASQLFAEAGFLRNIGQMWARSFPDPRDTTALYQVRMQNNMRIACLMGIGAIAHHFPSSQDLADHLLRLYTEAECRGCFRLVPKADEDIMACIHIPFPMLPHESWVDTSRVFPSLFLSVIESCVINCVNICHDVPDTLADPWDHIVGILSSKDMEYNTSSMARNKAARIILFAASTPEQYWRPLLETLYKQTYDKAVRLLSYVLRDYLCVTGETPDITKDPELHASLTRMLANAQHHRCAVVNPVDRFIMMMRQAAKSRPLSLALRKTGMPDLLRATVSGHYDVYNGGTTEPVNKQSETRSYVCNRMQATLDHDYGTEMMTRKSAVCVQYRRHVTMLPLGLP